MKCPHCQFANSSVIDSRPKDNHIWRRRKCDKCQSRFTTYESTERPDAGIRIGDKQAKMIVVFYTESREVLAIISGGKITEKSGISVALD